LCPSRSSAGSEAASPGGPIALGSGVASECMVIPPPPRYSYTPGKRLSSSAAPGEGLAFVGRENGEGARFVGSISAPPFRPPTPAVSHHRRLAFPLPPLARPHRPRGAGRAEEHHLRLRQHQRCRLRGPPAPALRQDPARPAEGQVPHQRPHARPPAPRYLVP